MCSTAGVIRGIINCQSNVSSHDSIMALQIKTLNKNEQPPDDAVMLRESEALKYQLTVLYSWEPSGFLPHVVCGSHKRNKENEFPNVLKTVLKFHRTEISNSSFSLTVRWPIKHGMLVLGLTTGLSAFYFNNYYRSRLRLLHFGKMSTYLPIVVVPSILTGFLHQKEITHRILLKPECPVCTEVRAALWQCVFGILYPLILAPTGSLAFALRYNTYDIPSIIHEKMKLFNLWKRMTKPLLTPITILSIVHIIMAMGLTHFEVKAFYRLQDEINKATKNREEL